MFKALIFPLIVFAVLFAPFVIILVNVVALAFVIGYSIYNVISKPKGEQYAS